MKKFIVICLVLLCTSFANAATYYVDSAVSSSGNGLAWATAWKAFSNITGLVAGDTVYISGGSTTKSYSCTSMTPYGGSNGNPITYKIGQTTGHNGTAIISASSNYVSANYVVISGDAGDGNRHFTFSSSSTPISGSGRTQIRISYVTYSSINPIISAQDSDTIEIDHCFITKLPNPTNKNTDHAFKISNVYGSWTFDNTKFHHNSISVPVVTSSNGLGDDAMKISGKGVSIYNNTIYTDTYPVGDFADGYGQHSDGFQSLGGQYIKIYNNIYKNFGGYAIFWDNFYNFLSCYTYNNLIYRTYAVSTGPPKGIASGPDGGYSSTFNDFIIANNTIADYGTHACISLETPGTTTATFINCKVQNNVCVNTGYPVVDSVSGITYTYHSQITSANGPATFTSYTAYSASNNFIPKSSDTVILNTGTSLASFFTTDILGNSRSGTWDRGAYEYNGAAPPADTTAPTVTQQSPSGTISCTTDPMTITEIASTNEAATLKWNATSVAYDSMSGTWSTTGGTTHSKSGSRACGFTYSFYMAGMDVAGNKSSPVLFTYTISEAVPDPVVFITGTRFGLNNSAHVQGTTLDLYNSVFNPTFSFDTAQFGFLRTSPADTAGRVIYYKTDLSTIPTNAVVSAAKLYMYQNEGDGDDVLNISVHQITGSAFSSSTTWATYAYADAIAAVESTEDAGLADGWREWDIKTMVEDWIATPANNKGLALLTDQGATHATEDTYRGLALSDNTDATIRPFIVVAYTIPAPDDKVLKGSGTLTITPGGAGTLIFKFKPE